MNNRHFSFHPFSQTAHTGFTDNHTADSAVSNRRKYKADASHDKLRRTAGFTLAELLAVVAIMTIVAAFGFVAVIRYRKSLKQEELDSTAREIFIAAQNHATVAKAAGSWDQYVRNAAAGTDTERQLGTPGLAAPTEKGAPTGYDAATFGNWSEDWASGNINAEHDFRHLTVTATNTANNYDITTLLLPLQSIDETLRLTDADKQGNIIIEYDTVTATVYSVWFSKDGAISGGTNGSTDADGTVQYSDANRDKSHRLELDYNQMVGYYGDAVNTSKKADEIEGTPSVAVTISNADKLTLNVAVTMRGASGTGTGAAGTGTSTSNYTISAVVSGVDSDGSTSVDSKHTISNAVGNDNYRFISAGNGYYYYDLDSVIDGDAGHFAYKFSDLTPGQDIVITVTATNSKDSSKSTTATVHTNSLFASVDGGTANIRHARHLENLSNEVSKVNESNAAVTITKANIAADIDWSRSFVVASNGSKGTYSKDGSAVTLSSDSGVPASNTAQINVLQPKNSNGVIRDGGSGATSKGIAYSLINDQLTEFAGNGHTISNLKLRQAFVSGNAGLIARHAGKNLTISNLTLKNPSIEQLNESTTNYAGFLIGQVNNADANVSITNCRITNTFDTTSVSARRAAAFVGTTNGKSLIFENVSYESNGSLSLEGSGSDKEEGYAGIFIGNCSADSLSIQNGKISIGKNLTVTGADYAGGAVGYTTAKTLSYTSGSIDVGGSATVTGKGAALGIGFNRHPGNNGRLNKVTASNITISVKGATEVKDKGDSEERTEDQPYGLGVLFGGIGNGDSGSAAETAITDIRFNLQKNVSITASGSAVAHVSTGVLVGDATNVKLTVTDSPLDLQSNTLTVSNRTTSSDRNGTGDAGGMIGRTAGGSLSISGSGVQANDIEIDAGGDAGGLIGYSKGTELTVRDSNVTAVETLHVETLIGTSKFTNAGGIVGHANATSKAEFQEDTVCAKKIEIKGVMAGGMAGKLAADGKTENTGLILNNNVVTASSKLSVTASPVSEGNENNLVTDSGFAGGLAGATYGQADIENCYVFGGGKEDIVSGESWVGGLIGYCIGRYKNDYELLNGGKDQQNIIICNCAASTYVELTNAQRGRDAAGGLIGLVNCPKAGSKISNCYAGGRTRNGSYGTETDEKTQGRFNVKVKAVKAGNEDGAFAAGFIGRIFQTEQSGLTISSCYTTASVYNSTEGAEDKVGSFIGQIEGEASQALTIEQCYTTGLVGTAKSTNEIDISDKGYIGTIVSGCKVSGSSNYYLKGVQAVSGSGDSAKTETQPALKIVSSGSATDLTVEGKEKTDAEASDNPFAKQGSTNQSAAVYDSGLTDENQKKAVDFPIKNTGLYSFTYPYKTTGMTASVKYVITGSDGSVSVASNGSYAHIGDWPIPAEEEQEGSTLRIENGNTLTAIVGIPKKDIETNTENSGAEYVSFAVHGNTSGKTAYGVFKISAASDSTTENPKYTVSVAGSDETSKLSSGSQNLSEGVSNTLSSFGKTTGGGVSNALALRTALPAAATATLKSASLSSNAPTSDSYLQGYYAYQYNGDLTTTAEDGTTTTSNNTATVTVTENPDYYYLEITLDDITKESCNFATLFCSNSETTKNLTPGEDITVYAYAAKDLKSWTELSQGTLTTTGEGTSAVTTVKTADQGKAEPATGSSDTPKYGDGAVRETIRQVTATGAGSKQTSAFYFNASKTGNYAVTNSLFADGSNAAGTAYPDGNAYDSTDNLSTQNAVDGSYHLGTYKENTGVLTSETTAKKVHVTTYGRTGDGFASTAIIMNGRHFQNISPRVSGIHGTYLGLNTAELRNDIVWSTREDTDGKKQTLPDEITPFINGSTRTKVYENGWHYAEYNSTDTTPLAKNSTVQPGYFRSIDTDYLQKLDGGSFYGKGTGSLSPQHTISNLKIQRANFYGNAQSIGLISWARTTDAANIDSNLHLLSFRMLDPELYWTGNTTGTDRGDTGILIGTDSTMKGTEIGNVTIEYDDSYSSSIYDGDYKQYAVYVSGDVACGTGLLIGRVGWTPNTSLTGKGDLNIHDVAIKSSGMLGVYFEYINSRDKRGVGLLFGTSNTAGFDSFRADNVTVEAENIVVTGTGTKKDVNAGGLVGYSVIPSQTITNCSVKAVKSSSDTKGTTGNITITGNGNNNNSYSGGLIGYAEGGTFTTDNSSVTAGGTLLVQADIAGGIAGYLHNQSSAKIGPDTATDDAKVVVKADIIRIFNRNNSSPWAGGLIGYAENSNSGSLMIHSALVEGHDVFISTEIPVKDDSTGAYTNRVSSITPSSTGGDAGGLIGKVQKLGSFEIKNSNVVAAGGSKTESASLRIVGKNAAGGLIGFNRTNTAHTIDNCHVIGGGNDDLIYSYYQTAGGLIGGIDGLSGTTLTISNDSASVYVESEIALGSNDAYGIGGLIGNVTSVKSGSSIINCYSGGRTSGGNYYVGNSTSTSKDYAAAGLQQGRFNIQLLNGNDRRYAGGLIGEIDSSTINIQDCYTTSSVYSEATGKDNIGSLIGKVNGGSVTVNNCYSTGIVGTKAASGSSDNTSVLKGVDISGHGFIGKNNGTSTISGSGNYYLSGVSGATFTTITDTDGQSTTSVETSAAQVLKAVGNVADNTGLNASTSDFLKAAASGTAPFTDSKAEDVTANATAKRYDTSLPENYPFLRVTGAPEVTVGSDGTVSVTQNKYGHVGDWPVTGGKTSFGFIYYEKISGDTNTFYYHGYTVPMDSTGDAYKNGANYTEIKTPDGTGSEYVLNNDGLVTNKETYVAEDGYLLLVPEGYDTDNLYIAFGNVSSGIGERLQTERKISELSATHKLTSLNKSDVNLNGYDAYIIDTDIATQDENNYYNFIYAPINKGAALHIYTKENYSNAYKAVFSYLPFFADTIKAPDTNEILQNVSKADNGDDAGYIIRSAGQLKLLQDSVNAENYLTWNGGGIIEQQMDISFLIADSSKGTGDVIFTQNGVALSADSSAYISPTFKQIGSNQASSPVVFRSSLRAEANTDSKDYYVLKGLNRPLVGEANVGYTGLLTYGGKMEKLHIIEMQAPCLIYNASYSGYGDRGTREICDITIDSSSFIADSNGKTYGAFIDNCTSVLVSDCHINDSVIAGSGMIGTNSDGTITDCSMENNRIAGDGFVGQNRGTIENVVLTNNTITGNGFAGSSSRSITDCFIKNAVIGKNGFVGTFEGGSVTSCQIYSDETVYQKLKDRAASVQGTPVYYLPGDNAKGYDLVQIGVAIDDSGNRKVTDQTVGGFVGTAQGWGSPMISKCSVTGRIYSTNLAAGFVYSFGDTNLTISGCYSNTAINAGTNGMAGGFAYTFNGKSPTLDSNHSLGIITAKEAAGFVYNNTNSGTIKNCYAAIWSAETNTENTDNASYFGFSRSVTGGTFENNFFLNEVEGQGELKDENSNQISVANGLSADGLKEKASGDSLATADVTKAYYQYMDGEDAAHNKLNTVYPYPVVKDMMNYGDWKGSEKAGELAYLEYVENDASKMNVWQYKGSSLQALTTTASTLDYSTNDKAKFAYGVIVPEIFVFADTGSKTDNEAKAYTQWLKAIYTVHQTDAEKEAGTPIEELNFTYDEKIKLPGYCVFRITNERKAEETKSADYTFDFSTAREPTQTARTIYRNNSAYADINLNYGCAIAPVGELGEAGYPYYVRLKKQYEFLNSNSAVYEDKYFVLDRALSSITEDVLSPEVRAKLKSVSGIENEYRLSSGGEEPEPSVNITIDGDTSDWSDEYKGTPNTDSGIDGWGALVYKGSLYIYVTGPQWNKNYLAGKRIVATDDTENYAMFRFAGDGTTLSYIGENNSWNPITDGEIKISNAVDGIVTYEMRVPLSSQSANYSLATVSDVQIIADNQTSADVEMQPKTIS